MANRDPLPSEDDLFDLGAALAAPRREVQDVFDLPLPSPPAAGPPPVPAPMDVEPIAPAPPARPAAAAPAPDDDEAEPVALGEPFPGLVSRAVRRRYHESLAAEGIFLFAPSPAAPAAAAPAPPFVPESVAADLAPARGPWPAEASPAEAPVEPAPFEFEPAPFELVPAEPAPEPLHLAEAAPHEPPPAEPVREAPLAFEEAPVAEAPPAAEPEPATVTLGELYLRQGHAGEAERIFREVLRREPENAAARAGLARAAAQPPPAEAVPLDRRARKVQVLSDYLERIRRGSGRHVS